MKVRHRVAGRHPEWWALTISGVAWVLIALPDTNAGANHHDARSSLLATPDVFVRSLDWLLMIVAMMLPLSVVSIQATAARSLWRRRHRAVAGWLVGYTAAWYMLGLAVTLLTASLRLERSSALLTALAFVVAALWHTTEWRARALRRCHRTQPLAPTGWRANYDCMRYGWHTGLHCVASCGVMMIACSLLGHGTLGLASMVTVTMVGLAERYMVRPNERWFPGMLGVLAVVIAMSASR